MIEIRWRYFWREDDNNAENNMIMKLARDGDDLHCVFCKPDCRKMPPPKLP
jgi:hypothetical protein